MVEVTHSQKDSHEEVDCCCLERVAIELKMKVRPSGNGGVTIPVSPLDTGIKDVVYTPYRSWFEGCYEALRNVLVS